MRLGANVEHDDAFQIHPHSGSRRSSPLRPAASPRVRHNTLTFVFYDICSLLVNRPGEAHRFGLRVELHFFGQRFPHVLKTASFGSSEFSEVGSGLGEAQRAIWSAPNRVGIGIILTIILPKANRADVEPTSFCQGLVSAAGTAIHDAVLRGPYGRLRLKPVAVLLKPLFASLPLFRRWFSCFHPDLCSDCGSSRS